MESWEMTDVMIVTLELDEVERQLVLLALAQLSLKNPGFDYALNLIAVKMDKVKGGRAELFDRFREARFRDFQELKKEIQGEEDQKGKRGRG
jgi:hypothetical protein